MHQSKKILLVLTLFSTAIALSGCVPKLSGGGGGPKTEEFVSGKVVRGFPASVPLYKNSQVVESYGGGSGWGASFITDDSLAKVVNFYNQSLSRLGWTVAPRQVDDTNYVFEIKNEKNIGKIIVNTAADGKKTAITMSIDQR